jgi:hypothetical protein
MRPTVTARPSAFKRFTAWSVAVMVRKSCASIAGTVQRRQEVQRRTWCSSGPARALLAWNASSTFRLIPAVAANAAKVTGAGGQQR